MSNSNTIPPIEFFPASLATPRDIDLLAEWSVASGEMIPLSRERMNTHCLSTVGYVAGQIASYAAVTEVYSGHVIEVGGLVVNPELRKRQVGTRTIAHVMNRIVVDLGSAPSMILAFANDKSKPLFEKLGGEVVEDVAGLPSEVWKQCYNCPRLEEARAMGKNCCDRVLNITSIAPSL